MGTPSSATTAAAIAIAPSAKPPRHADGSDREAELLPVGYFHIVYTLPSELRDVAWQNKRVVYDLLMKAAAETTLTIAADEKRLGAKIGITVVLDTWGSAMTHHPHVHMIVPGGGLAPDGSRWISARSNFLVHVNVLARLFRAKLLAMLTKAHDDGRLKFFNTHAGSPTEPRSRAFPGATPTHACAATPIGVEPVRPTLATVSRAHHDAFAAAEPPTAPSGDRRRSATIPIEPAAPTALRLPRLRALALLRRRPVRAASPSWPASENLHSISPQQALQVPTIRKRRCQAAHPAIVLRPGRVNSAIPSG